MSEILHSQEVEICGSDVGYQFARTRMGKRTIRTTVTVEGIENRGVVIWKNRKVAVRRVFPNSGAECLRAMWTSRAD